MIRRCTEPTANGAQCGMSEGHGSDEHREVPAAMWCLAAGCGQYKPAPGHSTCGECGGRHAKGKRSRGTEPPRFGKAQDKALNERRAKIARLMEARK